MKYAKNPLEDELDKILKIRKAIDRGRALSELLFDYYNTPPYRRLKLSIAERIRPEKRREADLALNQEVDRFGAGSADNKIQLLNEVKETLRKYTSTNPVRRKSKKHETSWLGITVIALGGYLAWRLSKQ